MVPRRRAEGDPPPVYETIDYASNFSLCINFDGYFLGVGKNRAYVNGKSIWYDYVEGDALTVDKLEDLVEQLGYEVQGRLHMYYCMPGKPMNEGGLVKITCNDNCLNMSAHVTFGHKYLQMYLDHDESFRQFDWGDVVQFPVTDLPTVVSPMKPIQTIKEEALDKHKQQMKEALEKQIKEEAFEKRQCQFVTHDSFGHDAEQAMEETLAQQPVEQTNADEQQAAEDFAKKEQERVVQEEEFAEEEQAEEDVPEEVSDFAYEFEEENDGELSDVEGNGSEEGSKFADDIAHSD